jgi:protein-tyrosine phosphatase
MSDAGSAGVKSTVGMYVHALHEVAAHLYRRFKFVRLAYERVTAPKVLPHPVRSVLFVCKGNVCRSPLAEGYFATKARKDGQAITVTSAGIETTPGKPAHVLAKEVARQHGISLDQHVTTPLFQDLMQRSDLVLVMEVAQKDRVAKLYPRERHKVFVLGQFCKRGSLDIDDPYSGTPGDFKVCFERIRESCDRVIQQIEEHGKVQASKADATQ